MENDHPINFIEKETGLLVPFPQVTPNRNTYICPKCGAEIEWYQAGRDSTRWICDCRDEDD